MMPTERELAYLAGFFDGEGSVLITKTRGRHVSPSYRIVLSAVNTNHQSLVDLRTAFGGSIGRIHTTVIHRKPAWQWHVACQKAAAVLQLLLPLLRIKRKEAEIALALQGVIDNRRVVSLGGRRGVLPLSVDDLLRREGFYQDIRSVRRESSSLQGTPE